MAVTPRTFFQPFAAAVFNGVHNFATDTLKIALTNIEPVNTYANLSSISEIAAGGGYSTGGFAVTTTASTQSAGVYKLILADYALTASGTIAEWQYAVLYNDTAAGNPLICWYAFAVPFNLASSDVFLFDFDGINGVINFSPGNASGGSVTLDVAPSSVAENGIDNLVFTFTRSGVISAPLTVSYTIGGTAVNGVDYSALGTSVVIGAGNTSADALVTPIDNADIDGDRTVTLTVAAGTGYVVGSPASATGTITNDDSMGDPNFAAVSLLLPMNGTNGSTSFPDESSNAFTVTAFNGAEIRTAEYKWGGSSGFLDGANDYCTVPGDAAFTFPGAFSVQGWVYLTEYNNSIDRTMVEVGSFTNGVLIRTDRSGADMVYVNGTDLGDVITHYSLNAWHWVSLTRNGSDLVEFAIDGTVRQSATISGTVNSTSSGVSIGRLSGFGGIQYYKGYQQDLRIVKGEARSHAVPTAALPTS